MASSQSVESTFPKFELLTLPFGLAKCGVLVTLNASARNCRWNVLRELERAEQAHVQVHDARVRACVFRPTLPNRTSVTRANALRVEIRAVVSDVAELSTSSLI